MRPGDSVCGWGETVRLVLADYDEQGCVWLEGHRRLAGDGG
jgi:hypothetical protein